MMSFSDQDVSPIESATVRMDVSALKKQLKPWIITFFAALFFFFEFIQINMFSSIDPDVMKSFHLNSTELGFLSSIFFYSTVTFLLPAGQLLDRFSPKKMMLASLATCIIGISLFATTTNLLLAGFSRFLEGFGSAFCFLGAIRIAANWFDHKHLALATGFVVTIGMLGGAFAQTPLTYAVTHLGWRHALLLNSVLGIVVFFLIAFFVQDAPNNTAAKIDPHTENYWESLRLAYLNKSNWACGAYTCLMNMPLVVLGALWGSLFLIQTHHFSREHASVIVSMIFFGTIVGSPLVGYLSDQLNNRKSVMLLGTLATSVFILLLMYLPHFSYLTAMSLFFLIGLTSSAQVLGYPTAIQSNPPELSAMSTSVVSLTTMTGYIIFMPLFGWLMEKAALHIVVNGVAIYTQKSYHMAFWMIPIAMILAALLLFMIRPPQH